MKTRMMTATLVATMSMSSPAIAFNPLEWILGKAVENAMEDAAKDAVKEAVFGTGTKGAPSARNGKGKRPEELVVGRAGKKDYLALPLTGQYRFAMPKDVALDALAVGPRGGYIDRFENEWVPVKGKKGVVRWLEYLSERGSLRMAWAADGRGHLLVGRDGKAIGAAES